jgi:hypothetical protein
MNDDQHTIAASIEKALTRHDRLIDSRTETDWLNFIAHIASLINFYDHHNRHRGTWEPFILKDPVFLAATISSGNHHGLHSSFKTTCAWLDKLMLQHDSGPAAGEAIGKLLHTLIDVFLILRKWVYYMQLSAEQYPLKNFTLTQVRDTYSQYLWSLLSLRKFMINNHIIKPPAISGDSETDLFEAVDGMIWKHHHEITPFWELLDLRYPLAENKMEDFITALKKAGDKLFHFLDSITGYAHKEMQQLQLRKARFPDTLLLRAFAHTLTIQQEQLNLITNKHLDFYYREVLKLRERNALPDHAFLCATLLQKNDVFLLPAGTLFDAGVDEKNIPVSFASTEDIILQPARVTGAYTISAIKDENKFRVFHSQVDDPGKVILADGQLKLWKTFGGDEASPVAQAFAFASPLLLLREGERCINVILYTDAAAPGSFDDVQFYLSTQKTWLPVNGKVINKIFDDHQQLTQVTIIIKLDATAPPIEAFIKAASGKDPDGLASDWPLLKMEFLSYTDPDRSLIIKSLKINVTVTGVKTLILYNDFGPLNTKAPFPLFGPAPLVNSNFIIGSSEIFSKPTDSLQLKLLWDKLPADLAAYYKEYNAWLNNDLAVPAKRKSIFAKLGTWLKTILQKFLAWLSRLFGKSPAAQSSADCPVFNNTGFTVDFSVLEKSQWKDIDAVKAKDLVITVDDNNCNTISYTPYLKDKSCPCSPVLVNKLLFSTNGTSCELTADSSFVLFDQQQTSAAFAADPYIQQNVLAYTGHNGSGFLRIGLSGPEHGFGSAIYSSVLNGIALQNAWILYNSQPGEDFFGFKEEKEKPVFIEPAKLPLAPKLNSLEINYSSTQVYSFVDGPAAYPLQCFYYTSFYKFKAYDNNDLQLTPHPARFFYNQSAQPNGLCIFQPTSFHGILFITLDQLIPSREINFYFELRQRSGGNQAADLIRCSYLSNTGWKELALRSDTTYNFTCSGILKWIVPNDIAPGSDPDPTKKYYFAIATTGDPLTKAATAFVSVNGIPVERSLLPLSQFKAAILPAGSITQPVKAIPSITGLLQPFASFGGRATELPQDMYLRVANRLSTKDRVVTKMDVHQLIKEQFPGIYSCAILFTRPSGTINVYAVASAGNDTSGYIPFVNDNVLAMVREMLATRTSSLYKVTTSNFNFKWLQVVMQLKVSDNFQQTRINNALRIYLSPWIINDEQKMNIKNLILAPGETSSLQTKIAVFVKNMEGVTSVKNIQFRVWGLSQAGAGEDPASEISNHEQDHCLLIPATQHDITILT